MPKHTVRGQHATGWTMTQRGRAAPSLAFGDIMSATTTIGEPVPWAADFRYSYWLPTWYTDEGTSIGVIDATPPTYRRAALVGWKCPNCGAGVSPNVDVCPACKPWPAVMYGTTTSGG